MTNADSSEGVFGPLKKWIFINPRKTTFGMLSTILLGLQVICHCDLFGHDQSMVHDPDGNFELVRGDRAAPLRTLLGPGPIHHDHPIEDEEDIFQRRLTSGDSERTIPQDTKEEKEERIRKEQQKKEETQKEVTLRENKDESTMEENTTTESTEQKEMKEQKEKEKEKEEKKKMKGMMDDERRERKREKRERKQTEPKETSAERNEKDKKQSEQTGTKEEKEERKKKRKEERERRIRNEKKRMEDQRQKEATIAEASSKLADARAKLHNLLQKQQEMGSQGNMEPDQDVKKLEKLKREVQELQSYVNHLANDEPFGR